MGQSIRITLYGNAVFVYHTNPAIPHSVLGPKGNYVQGVYDSSSRRIRYEAAIRGYGDAAQVLLDRLLAIADRIAVSRKVGGHHGPVTETEIGTAPFR